VSLNVFPGVPENGILGANRSARNRRSKNSGGRIAPAAIGGLIEALFSSVNAFPEAGAAIKGLVGSSKALARLNFLLLTGIGRSAIRLADGR